MPVAITGDVGSNPTEHPMLPQVKPIGGTQIDFNIFLKSCQEALNYSPMKGVDGCNRELSDPAKLLASLAAFKNKLDSQDPIKAIRDASSILRHLSYIFLVYCDQALIADIREMTQLNVTSTTAPDGERVVVVSGSLFDFRIATIECCVLESSLDIRYFFDSIVLYFQSIGLGDLWFGYRMKPQKDRTFLLEYIP